MKKLISMILVLVLALACAAAHGEEDGIPQPEGGKKFETNWAIFGMTVEILYEEAGYRVYIRSTDPYGHNGSEWEYSCAYNDEKDALISITSSKNSWSEDPATGSFERGEYEYQDFDGEGEETVFTINGEGRLTWEDGRGDDGADLVFSDIGAFSGYWASEDGSVWTEITWSDSEIGDEYGYTVYLHEADDTGYILHGLYDPETGKLNVAGEDSDAELTFSDLGNGQILLERDNLVLTYDFLGGSQG